MSSHLNPDQLADLQEGLLEPAEAAAATAHLASCAHCEAEATALRAITQRLVAAGDVGPMPAEIAERLDTAIVQAQGSAESEAVNVIPLSSRRSTWATRKWLQAAAGLVLVVTGSAIVLPTLSGVGDRGGNETSAAKVGDAAPDVSAIETDTNYTEQSLPAEVSRRLKAPEAYQLAVPPNAQESRDNSGAPAAKRVAGDRLADPEALAGCVAALTPTAKGGEVVLVDIAKFNGKPATVIVLELPEEPKMLGAWVVGPGCHRGNAETMHYQSLPRP